MPTRVPSDGSAGVPQPRTREPRRCSSPADPLSSSRRLRPSSDSQLSALLAQRERSRANQLQDSNELQPGSRRRRRSVHSSDTCPAPHSAPIARRRLGASINDRLQERTSPLLQGLL